MANSPKSSLKEASSGINNQINEERTLQIAIDLLGSLVKAISDDGGSTTFTIGHRKFEMTIKRVK